MSESEIMLWIITYNKPILRDKLWFPKQFEPLKYVVEIFDRLTDIWYVTYLTMTKKIFQKKNRGDIKIPQYSLINS